MNAYGKPEIRWPLPEGIKFGATYCSACRLMIRFPFLILLARYLENRYKNSLKNYDK